LDLIEYEADPAKQSLSNIQHLWQQVRVVQKTCALLNQNSSQKPTKTSAAKQQKH